MNPTVRRAILVNGLWLFAILATVVGLVGGSAWRLQAARARVSGLSASLADHERRAAAEPDLQQRRELLDGATAVLDGWAALVDSEARRISDVSAAAQASGVTLVSLGGFQRGEREGGFVRTSSHRLVSLGAFQQLARFLHALHRLGGMLAVEDLELEPAGGGPGRLRASMRVVWSARGDGPDGPDAPDRRPKP